MENNKLTGLDKLFQAFSPRDLQISFQIIDLLKKSIYTRKSFQDWILNKIETKTLFDTRPIIKIIEDKISRHEITIDDLEKAIRQIKREKQVATKVQLRMCPDCGFALEVYSINQHPTAMIGDSKYRTWWICGKCGWEEFSEKNIDDELKPYLED